MTPANGSDSANGSDPPNGSLEPDAAKGSSDPDPEEAKGSEPPPAEAKGSEPPPAEPKGSDVSPDEAKGSEPPESPLAEAKGSEPLAGEAGAKGSCRRRRPPKLPAKGSLKSDPNPPRPNPPSMVRLSMLAARYTGVACSWVKASAGGEGSSAVIARSSHRTPASPHTEHRRTPGAKARLCGQDGTAASQMGRTPAHPSVPCCATRTHFFCRKHHCWVGARRCAACRRSTPTC